ncbi:MAG: acetoacetate decarboxylase [Chlamydiae bacterium]|nr:acetoacetate decarboxylase [Chlamydiota bacterium]
MNSKEIASKAFAMPLCSPSYPKAPFHFVNREYLIITYETDLDVLRAIVPEPLEVVEPYVKFEFMSMPDSHGFGNYSEAGQVIPVRYKDKPGNYYHSMFLDNFGPIAAGREIWGFPKALAQPSLKVHTDVLTGKLMYHNEQIALGTMAYKYKALDTKAIEKNFSETPNYLLKIIPDVDGSPRICELVYFLLTNVNVKEAWEGPAELELIHHTMAPVAQLPIKKIVSAVHLLTDVTLPFGHIAHDYLKHNGN